MYSVKDAIPMMMATAGYGVVYFIVYLFITAGG